MSSRRGGGKCGDACGSTSAKGKNIVEAVEELNQGVAEVNLNSAETEGGWEVFSKKSKNRGGSSSAKARPSQNFATQVWGHSDHAQRPSAWNNGGSGRGSGTLRPVRPADPKIPAGRGTPRPQSYGSGIDGGYVGSQAAARPPIEHGWNWHARAGAMQSDLGKDSADEKLKNVEDDVEEDDSDVNYSDDEVFSDDYDSDASQKSHETRKKSKLFKKLFASLDTLSLDEINEPGRQWHCPACQGDPGAIDWYRGLQPLMTHAKTKGSQRVKLHRELAELLEEELKRRGTSVIPAGESFGQWTGLAAGVKDHEIVWPPMVIIMNTKLEQDENEKWIGMGNHELVTYFHQYNPLKARHSYSPQGHRGMSVLIFESSPQGYFNAELLHKRFISDGLNRDAWDRRHVSFVHGGKRQLYGYFANKNDMENFNQHAQGKSRVKYEMRSYHEMVVQQLRQMGEDNEQLVWYKNAVVKEQRHAKALEESFDIVTEKLRKTMEENRIVRQRTRMQHEQTQEEMDYQEKFFKDQITVIHATTSAKEEDFERLQQQERERVKQSNPNPSGSEAYRRRAEEIARFIQIQEKEMEEFVAERDDLLKRHGERLADMRKRHWAEEVALEEEFDALLTNLMKKYAPEASKS